MEKKSYAEVIAANCGKRCAYWFADVYRHRCSVNRAWEGIAPVHLWKGKGVDTGFDALWWLKASSRDLRKQSEWDWEGHTACGRHTHTYKH